MYSFGSFFRPALLTLSIVNKLKLENQIDPNTPTGYKSLPTWRLNEFP